MARKTLFALGTLLLLFAALEGGLRAVGVEAGPDRTTTWFADHILHPPLVRHQRVFHPRLHYFTPGQASQFYPFAADRPPHSLRVAVLGGSAAHGYGVLEPAAFPHQIERLLQQALPSVEVQVINFGTIAWSSQQLLWAARQLWDLSSWDLVVIYAGHNELLELSSWKTYLEPAAHRRYTKVLLWTQRLESLRLFQWARELLSRGGRATQPDAGLGVADARPLSLGQGRAPAPAAARRQIEAGGGLGAADIRLLSREQGSDHSTAAYAPAGDVSPGSLVAGIDPVAADPAHRLGGMQALPAAERATMGTLEWRYAARTYRHNVGKIVDLARTHGTAVLLVSPAPNDLQDPISFPPAGVAGERLEAGLAEVRGLMDRSELVAMQRLARTLIDEYGDARAMYLLALALHHQGHGEQARHWYDQARRHTEYPSRIVPAVHDAILAMAEAPGVLAAMDMEAHFRDAAPAGVIGYDLIYDHCHPTVAGHLLIAARIVEQLFASGWPALAEAKRLDVEAWLQSERAHAASQRSPDPRLWRWDGRSYSSAPPRYLSGVAGGFEAVRADLEQRVTSASATAMDWLWVGNARFYGYDVEAALQAWDLSLRLDPSLCTAWANRSYALRVAGGRADAMRAARKAVDCAPDDAEYAQMLALLRRLPSPY